MQVACPRRLIALGVGAALLLAPGRLRRGSNMMPSSSSSAVRIMMTGDVMLGGTSAFEGPRCVDICARLNSRPWPCRAGRGVDMILPHHCDPILYEDAVRDARVYVQLAVEANGALPRHRGAAYPWGIALQDMEASRLGQLVYLCSAVSIILLRFDACRALPAVAARELPAL